MKRFVAVLLCFVMLTMTGCGNSNGEEGKNEQIAIGETTVEETTISPEEYIDSAIDYSNWVNLYSSMMLIMGWGEIEAAVSVPDISVDEIIEYGYDHMEEQGWTKEDMTSTSEYVESHLEDIQNVCEDEECLNVYENFIVPALDLNEKLNEFVFVEIGDYYDTSKKMFGMEDFMEKLNEYQDEVSDSIDSIKEYTGQD